MITETAATVGISLILQAPCRIFTEPTVMITGLKDHFFRASIWAYCKCPYSRGPRTRLGRNRGNEMEAALIPCLSYSRLCSRRRSASPSFGARMSGDPLDMVGMGYGWYGYNLVSKLVEVPLGECRVIRTFSLFACIYAMHRTILRPHVPCILCI